MSPDTRHPSARQSELLEAAYGYVLTRGLTDVSLRPLATAIGSSPRVLLYLFGSKDGLICALLARARTDELAMLDALRHDSTDVDLTTAATRTWQWLSDPRHRKLLTLWAQAYTRSLSEPAGPWAGFAEATVHDWLDLLSQYPCPEKPSSDTARPEPTAVLAVLRGALLDLLATGDGQRTTATVHYCLAALTASPRPRTRR